MRLDPKFSLGSWAFSFGPFALAPWSFDRFLQYAADAGYDGVEINGFRPHPHPDDYDTPAKCRKLRQVLDDWGLGISGYAPQFTDDPSDIANREAYLATIAKSLRFCESVGIDVLRVDTVAPPVAYDPGTYQRRLEHLCGTWRQAAGMCRDAGVKLVWEFEPGFWLNKPSEVLTVVDTVDDPSFGVLFDTSHAYMSAVLGARHTGEKEILPGGVATFGRLLRGRIGHVHFIDSDGTLHNGETSTHAPFGTGRIDFKEVILALEPDLRPLTWWCFDFCFCPTTETDARKALPYMRTCLKQVAEAQER
jgi:sugar phosphate isomerase/epimerase